MEILQCPWLNNAILERSCTIGNPMLVIGVQWQVHIWPGVDCISRLTSLVVSLYQFRQRRCMHYSCRSRCCVSSLEQRKNKLSSPHYVAVADLYEVCPPVVLIRRTLWRGRLYGWRATSTPLRWYRRTVDRRHLHNTHQDMFEVPEWVCRVFSVGEFDRVNQYSLELRAIEYNGRTKISHCVKVQHTVDAFDKRFPYLALLLLNLGYSPPSWMVS